jgi:hypothetical protein
MGADRRDKIEQKGAHDKTTSNHPVGHIGCTGAQERNQPSRRDIYHVLKYKHDSGM